MRRFNSQVTLVDESKKDPSGKPADRNSGPGARAGKRSTESRLSFFKLTLCIQSFSHHPTLIATPAQDHKAYLHASKLFMRPPTLKDAHTHNTMITSHVKLRSRARPDQHRSQSYSTRVVVRQNRPLETARLSETSRRIRMPLQEHRAGLRSCFLSGPVQQS